MPLSIENIKSWINSYNNSSLTEEQKSCLSVYESFKEVVNEHDEIVTYHVISIEESPKKACQLLCDDIFKLINNSEDKFLIFKNSLDNKVSFLVDVSLLSKTQELYSGFEGLKADFGYITTPCVLLVNQSHESLAKYLILKLVLCFEGNARSAIIKTITINNNY